MKKYLFVFSPLVLATAYVIVIGAANISGDTIRQSGQTLIESIGCAPGAVDAFYPDENGKFITLLPGWGNHTYSITSQNDSARSYFNQGLSMYYSYHMREAIASFKEAARFDSTCAMAYWGQALAMGPTYNSGYLYKMDKRLPPIVESMNRFAGGASVKEQQLIAAMNQRYILADVEDRQRDSLNEAYAAAMKPLVNKHPFDLDIKALYVDAVMLVHPWTFWNNDGSPKAWTPEVVQYCKDILKKDPHHPAGLHYYIHVTEASRQPEVALPSADSLLKLFPGVAHMVHMSSHEYERIGFYAKGVDANEKADNSLGQYYSLAKGLSLSPHVTHYFAVDAYCAMSGAMYEKGLQKAYTCRQSAEPSPERTYQQYLYMFPLFAMVRMGKWHHIIADQSAMEPDWTYAQLLNNFAKGMAFSKTGNDQQAAKHLQQLREQMKDSILKEKFTPFMSSAYECAVVAENILAATISYNRKDYNTAMTNIKKAILAEDSLLYSEPKIWILPARQYLGQFLMEMKKPGEAEKVYREDLVWNPGNGWSLLGLYKSLQAQGKTSELNELKRKYLYSFSGADSLPQRSAY